MSRPTGTRIARSPEVLRRNNNEILATAGCGHPGLRQHHAGTDLLALGLIDEQHLMVGAVIVRSGTPASTSLPTDPHDASAHRCAAPDNSGSALRRYTLLRGYPLILRWDATRWPGAEVPGPQRSGGTAQQGGLSPAPRQPAPVPENRGAGSHAGRQGRRGVMPRQISTWGAPVHR